MCRGVGDLRNSITSHMRVTLTPLYWCGVAWEILWYSHYQSLDLILCHDYWWVVVWEIWEIPLRVTGFDPMSWLLASRSMGDLRNPIMGHWILPYVMTTGESWHGRSEKSHYGSHESDPMSWLLTSNENSIWETMKVLLPSKNCFSVYEQSNWLKKVIAFIYHHYIFVYSWH